MTESVERVEEVKAKLMVAGVGLCSEDPAKYVARGLTVADALTAFEAIDQLQRDNAVLREGLADLRTHRRAWMEALKLAKSSAVVEPPDRDDKSYWRQEIKVFNRTFDALLNQDNRSGE